MMRMKKKKMRRKQSVGRPDEGGRLDINGDDSLDEVRVLPLDEAAIHHTPIVCEQNHTLSWSEEEGREHSERERERERE